MSHPFEEQFNRIRQEFLELAAERLDHIESLLFPGNDDTAGDDDARRLAIYREVHTLKGNGGTFGLHAVSLIAHRLEDFLSERTALDEQAAGDVVGFVDALRGIVRRGSDVEGEALRDLLRALPTSHDDTTGPHDAQRFDILLVTPLGTVGKAISTDLRASGHTVITVASPWRGLELAVRTQPDLVISSVEMDGLNGIDFVRALAAMSVTRHLPVALLTSYGRDHRSLAAIDTDMPMIRIGRQFQADLNGVLTRVAA